MDDDRSADLIEDIIEAIAHGDVADSLLSFNIDQPEKSVLEVDIGEPTSIYVVTVARVARSAHGD